MLAAKLIRPIRSAFRSIYSQFLASIMQNRDLESGQPSTPPAAHSAPQNHSDPVGETHFDPVDDENDRLLNHEEGEEEEDAPQNPLPTKRPTSLLTVWLRTKPVGPRGLLRNIRRLNAELVTGACLLFGAAVLSAYVLYWTRTTVHPWRSLEVVAVVGGGILGIIIATWGAVIGFCSGFDTRGDVTKEHVAYAVWKAIFITVLGGILHVLFAGMPHTVDGWWMFMAPGWCIGLALGFLTYPSETSDVDQTVLR
ncbi:hypothetical protein CLAFUW4_04995 [Fulvia fulva]|uniref:Uncharacterized protein n=1 Tax=Passalora fulva TaxID=5499 RepID=A0A9Q8PHZ4_PASFU|nr:uncharacterized protein CLAFUR5_11912 [Fulvia fulva]KAK4626335.1 hypothetical protein CLAFUR4_04981 [Fulvia fulva]KAK4627761.1 hypothetical protein CLAFUR0_04985 [Fulvia fulva]UJO22771.1 hypothetical protein CLAFUR5_11912 [Fulvia fulva]WPV14379.1 hypothetical protein CLAFUW4_04995 [Fulvia fulva]WPV28396.1 hypothetical protein CLAFUW7_04989 [Fulvia fulva]